MSDETVSKVDARDQAGMNQSRSKKWTFPLGILGALLVIFQFFGAQYEGRVQRSLDRIKAFNVEVADSAQFISDYWSERYKDSEDSEDVIPIDILQQHAEGKIKEDKEYRQHVRSLRIFYHELSLCVNLGNCDAFTACQYFDGKVSNYLFIHARYFEKYMDLMLDDNKGKQITYFNDEICSPMRRGNQWSNKTLRYINGFLNL